MLCNFFENRGIDITYAYINTINYQEDSHSTHFSLSMFNTGAMLITDYTHSHFSNSAVCLSFTILGGHCLYISKFVNFPPYSRGSINYCIMKTRSELWRSFSITIWWTIYIKYNLLPLVFFLDMSNVFLYLLYSHFYNIILIWKSLLIFFIV